ncbi:MAG: response regulator [Bacillota bacterium]
MSKTIILIIDDELEMHWALEKALQQEGYEILKAASGTEGLQILASQEVSIVLLDYKMPGMTGLEALEQIRKQWPDLPVIFMTGYSSIPTATDSIAKGTTAYVSKPFRLDDIKETIKRVLSTVK